MRFMILIHATPDSEAGLLPDPALFTAMNRFNEELVQAGVMLGGEGLHPSSRGARAVVAAPNLARRCPNPVFHS